MILRGQSLSLIRWGLLLPTNCASPNTSVLVTAPQQNNLNVTPGTNTFASNNITTKALKVRHQRPGDTYKWAASGDSDNALLRRFYIRRRNDVGVSRGDGSGGGLASGFVAGDLFYGSPFPYSRRGVLVYGASGCVAHRPFGIGSVALRRP